MERLAALGVVAALLVPALAGCLRTSEGPGDDVVDEGVMPRPEMPVPIWLVCPPSPRDCSREWINVTVAAADDRGWTLRLPLPVSPNGTSFDDWFVNVTVRGPAKVWREDAGGGELLVVEGRGDVDLRAVSMRFPPRGETCCAEAFLAASWSAVPPRSGEGVPVRVGGNMTHLSAQYEAMSDLCARREHGAGEDLHAPGWTWLGPPPRPQRPLGTTCT